MNAGDWEEIKPLLERAADLPAAERERFVSEHCPDPERRREILELLASPAPLSAIVTGGALQPGAQLGPYVVQALIGRGGMGEVYRARDSRLGRDVAIKILPPLFATDRDRLDRFAREAKLLAALNHPHICTLHDIGRQDGLDFLVMEHVEGVSLADRLSKGALPVADAVRYAIQIADALDKAHARGVVHRDLKPGNVILARSGAKLLDFGIARMVPAAGLSALTTRLNSSAPGQHRPLTAAGAIIGTYQYMAPEQIEGEEADARSDIWAFGCLLYEMVTGRRAFEGQSAASLAGAILAREPAPLSTAQSSAPAALDHVVRRCLAKSREERWQAAADIRHELTWIAEGGSEAATPATVAPRNASRRERLAWSVAAFSLLALVALTVYGSVRARGEAPQPQMRFTLGLPASAGRAEFPALSRDGRRLAFVGQSAGGSGIAVWVRSIDALDARVLPGTEGPRSGQNHPHPFWAPDGHSLGVFLAGKLKRIDVANGATQVICDAADGRGGAWNRDGTIIFAPDPFSPLYRVDAGGASTPAPLTTLDTSSGEHSHRLPSFLADGRHFVFTVFRANGRNSIRLGSLDSPTTTELIAPAAIDGNLGANTSQAFVAGGRLLFARGGALLAQWLDQRRWQLTGEPSPIVPRVDDDDNGRTAFAASEDGLIVYRPPAPPALQQLTWFSRAGTQQDRVWEPGQFDRFSIAPDGGRAAVSRTDPQTNRSGILIVDLARGTASPLLDERDAEFPLWSPDGMSIIFSASRGYGTDDISSRAADGTGAARLLLGSSATRKYAFGWLPDGGLLAAVGNQQRRFDIWTLRATGDRPPTLSMKNESEAGFLTEGGAVSPDGHWIAYTAAGELYVRAFPSGPRVLAASDARCCPAWRPDGRELYYVSRTDTLMTADVRPGATIALSAPKRLMDLPSGFRDYWPSTDGLRFLLAIPAGPAPAPEPLTVIVNWMNRRPSE